MSEYMPSDGSEYHFWFDSLEEFASKSDELVKNGPNSGRWLEVLTSYRYNEVERNGVGSQREAMRKCIDGWPELLPILHEKVAILKQQVDLGEVEAVSVSMRRRKRTRNDYGDSLDITRVWSGQLDKAWERPVRRQVMTATQRYATIFVDLAMFFDNTFEQSLWRAALAYCLVEVLTGMGINTEIWCGSSHVGQFMSPSYPRKSWRAVRIKEYTQPLTDERLAAMVSAGFHRTWGWKMICAQPMRVNDGFGMPMHNGLVKPLRDRKEAGERVFRIGGCMSLAGAIIDLNAALETLKNHKEAA